MSERTTHDGAETLSALSGLSRDEMLRIWVEVKANNRKLDACVKHRFSGGTVKIGEKVTCLECGGNMMLVSVRDYIAGYQACGGNADDIWPDYHK